MDFKESTSSVEYNNKILDAEMMFDNSFVKHLTPTGENLHRKYRLEKCTRKAVQSLENLLKDLPDDRARLEFMLLRYEDVYQDFSTTQLQLRSDRKEMNSLRRVVEECKSEHLQIAEARKRLENVCKDLQAQNKHLKEETLALHRDEEQKRLQVVDKFQKTLAEVSEIVQDNVRKNTKLHQNNMDILNRLTLAEKSIQQREQQVQCLEKQLKLQEELGKAGVLKARVEVDDIRTEWTKEREAWQQREQDALKVRFDEKTRHNSLQLTLDGYIDKLEAMEYSNTINKEKTEKYKGDLCHTQSENIVLLKKIKLYKERIGNQDKKAEEMRHKIKVKMVEVNSLAKRMEKLDRVCRKLQLDRALFLKLLQDNHIEASGETGINNTPTEPTE